MRWKVGRYDLKSNGVPTYHFYDSGGTTHICGVGYRVGAVHDPLAFAGKAHIIEHLSFRGPNVEKPEEDDVYNMIYRYFGGMENHNIFTNYTATFYGGPGLYYRRYMHPVMQVLVNILKLRYVDAKGLDIEKTVVNNEFRQMDLDVAESRLEDLFLNTMYDTNPVRRGIIGDVGQLRNLTLGRVMKFIKERYVAENMFVIVFGPKKDEAVAFARKYFDDWPYRGQAVSLDLNSFDRVPILSSPRIIESAVTGFAQHYVMAGFSTGCYESKDDAALDVVSKVLERRLYNVLREKGTNFYEGTYHDPAFTNRTLAHGNIGAWFATASVDFARYGRDAIIKELLKLREEKISSVLFDGLRDSAREGFFENFRDNPSEVVELVIKAITNGDPDLKHFHSYVDRLNRLTPSRLR
ncbi:MAG: insulinase family protein, partial [Candidatus Yanofskybacteria bacterium]|nr:insulinase family protein [Candidatus Yanofskybacteria bacterium]